MPSELAEIMNEEYKKHIPVFSTVDLNDDGTLLIFPESVVLLGVLTNDSLVLVEQFRKSVDRKTLELPGGRVKPGENPSEAVRRELLEESGFYCSNVEHIFTLDMDFSISKHKTHLFYGKLLHKESSKEDMSLRLYNLSEVLALVFNRQITHAPTVAAILWLNSRARK